MAQITKDMIMVGTTSQEMKCGRITGSQGQVLTSKINLEDNTENYIIERSTYLPTYIIFN